MGYQVMIAEKFPWVTEVYELDLTGKPRHARRLLFEHIEDVLHAGDWEGLRDLLADKRWDECSADVMVGLLRTTFRARRSVSEGWSNFYVRVHNSLRRSNFDQDSIDNMLMGLAPDGTRIQIDEKEEPCKS
jgi:hypothetical protein